MQDKTVGGSCSMFGEGMENNHMRTSIARLIAVFGLLIGALAFGTAVSANNGNGSSFSTGTQCSTYFGDTYCFSSKGEVNTTISKDGTYHYEMNARGTISLSYTGYRSSDTYTAHSQLNGDKENHLMYKATQTFNGQSFCITQRFHEANGQVQFDSFSATPGAC